MELINLSARSYNRRRGDRVEGAIVSLASCEYHFIKVHENLVQHLGNNISIGVTFP